MKRFYLLSGAIAPMLLPWFASPLLAQALTSPLAQANTQNQAPAKKPDNTPASPPRLRTPTACPSDVQPLAQILLRDLSGYINRVYARVVYPQVKDWSYALVVSQPETEPLPVNAREYPNPEDENLQQIFFTVLERQYRGDRSILLQHYHWLFLTKTQTGWQVAFLFSRVGSYPADAQATLTPPSESSESTTAEAIRLWLRDCQAGIVRQEL